MAISGTAAIGDGPLIIFWVTTAVLLLGLSAFSFMSITAPVKIRHFYYILGFSALISATLYFSMATGIGSIRQGRHLVFFARYIDWMLTTPLLLLSLALVALPRVRGRVALIGVLLGIDEYMIVAGLLAALLHSNLRWVWFGMGVAAFLLILYIIRIQLSALALGRDTLVADHFTLLERWLIGLWICYPIVWLAGGEGFGLLSLFWETFVFALLDVLAKVGFGLLLLGNRQALLRTEPGEAQGEVKSNQKIIERP